MLRKKQMKIHYFTTRSGRRPVFAYTTHGSWWYYENSTWRDTDELYTFKIYDVSVPKLFLTLRNIPLDIHNNS